MAAAAVVGFAGNELVARYRVNAGRRIGSAALVADGLHARTDGLASLAVLLGVGGSALGWQWADPAVGLHLGMALVHADPQPGVATGRPGWPTRCHRSRRPACRASCRSRSPGCRRR